MSMIYAKYASGTCDNCKKNISVKDKIPAFDVCPYEDLPRISFFLCEECARKIKGDYTVEEYFKIVDEAKRRIK